MSRPLVEVADLVRSAGTAFIERNRQWLARLILRFCLPLHAVAPPHSAVISMSAPAADIAPPFPITAVAIAIAQSARRAPANSGSRPRRRELLPVPYVHIVFTLPPQLAPLALQNKKVIYGLLLRVSAETLLEVARNPRHLGAEIGFFSVLHTWNQKLQLHPHVHCVVPSGGRSLDHTRWIRSRPRFFLPIYVLRRVFRGKFVAGLKSAFQRGQLHLSGNLAPLAQPKIFASCLRPLFRKDWVVYSKPPFGGPEYVLHYLGRYTHRVAISNHRLLSFDDGQVTFRWRDSAHNNEQKLMTLSLDEFLRRFLLHLLPKGFVRIRHFGFLANRRRAQLLPLCFAALDSARAQTETATSTTQNTSRNWICPKCGGPMIVIEKLSAAQIQLRSPPKMSMAAA